ncbi:DUF6348 family protein [Dyella subtropica]|uniref:DUF6348 family protein n=1 Tax=Dyella subtropica TaxID=2992127 RepID=UPI0022507587|nr:DUF6348 family protein [Dyella subtropica]
MNDAALEQYLLNLFADHDIELEPDEDGWLLTDGDFPAIRATWHPGDGDQPGRLDIDVVISEERHIEESFAGYGQGDAACRDALDAFVAQALHPLLAACWYVTDDRKIHIEAWDIGVRTWDVFHGATGIRGALTVPPETRTALADALRRMALTPELHWVRVFYTRAADGSVSAEASFDNEPWAEGTAAITSAAWPHHEEAGSARWLTLLDVRDY